MASVQPTCDSCGALLPVGTPHRLCPQCRLTDGLHSQLVERGSVIRCPNCQEGIAVDPFVPASELRCSECGQAFAPRDVETVSFVQTAGQIDTLVPTGGGADSAQGRSLGDYVVIEEIARGGMGVVYKARQTKLNRLVAVKMIKSGEFADASEIQRFRGEAEAAARLNHPNIVAIHEVGETDGQHFYSMAYVDGRSLAQSIREGPWRPRQAAELTRTIAEAVEFAHRNGVIHRDLKPGNVLLDHDGQPHVTDFGLAKRIASDTNLTQTGQVIGTPGYMPPEQAAGRIREIGPASDTYSVGAILYCLLTGRPPFQAATAIETIRQVIEREPVSPRLLNSAIGRDLETICMKCLEKEANKRYRSAGEVAEELSRFLDGRPILARPVSLTTRIWRWGRRHPARAVTALLVPIVIIAGIGLAVSYRYQQRLQGLLEHETELKDNAEDARVAEVQAKEQLDRVLYARRIGQAHQAWIDGSVLRAEDLLETCPERFRNWEWHYLFRLCHSELLTIRGIGAQARHVAFSPDGRLIAVAGGLDNNVRVFDATTGDETITIAGHTAPVTCVTFTTDGQRVVSGGYDNKVKVWDVQTGEMVFAVDSSFPNSVAVSPDGRLLASNHPKGTAIMVWNAKTGEELLTLTGHTRGITSIAFNSDSTRIVSGGTEGAVRVWDATSGEQLRMLSGHTNWVQGVAFNPEGNLIASASIDRTIRIWNVELGESVRTIGDHSGFVNSVAFSPDGKRICSACADNMVRIWRIYLPHVDPDAKILRGHTDAVNDATFSPDGQRIVSVSNDTTVRFWDSAPEQAAKILRGHEGRVNCVQFAPDGRSLVSAGTDNTIVIWDVESSEPVTTLSGNQGGVNSVTFSPDGEQLASAGQDGTVKLWNMRSREETLALTAHTGPVERIAFGRDGTLITAGGLDDSTVRFWDVRSGTEKFEKLTFDSTVVDLQISPDGRLLALAEGGAITFWELSGSGPTKVNMRLDGDCFAFSPDGATLASAIVGASDSMIRLWDVASGDQTLELGPTLRVYDLAFSPDGLRIASTASDHTISVWDAVSGEECVNLKGHRLPVNSITFSPDGRLIASGDDEAVVRVWSADSGHWPAPMQLP